MLRVLQGSAGQKIRGHGYLLVYMKTAKKSNPQPFFSPKSRKWRKKSIARQHLHVPRSCRRRLAILQQLSLKQDDLEWPPLLPGCGTQHPLRGLGGTRLLLGAAPTPPPPFPPPRGGLSALLWPYSAENRFLIPRLSHSAECSKRIFTRGGHSGKQSFYSNNAKAARPPGRGSLAAGSYSTGFMLAGSSTAPG